MKKKLKVYICGNDLLDLNLGATDVTLYPTMESLKSIKSCWKECGIIEIDLSNYKVKVKGSL